MKSATQALEGATVSLPTSLHTPCPTLRQQINLNLCQMNHQRKYCPTITLSKGASEDGERVSFLEQQIQQAKDTYKSSLKNVIEECITLETTALQSQESDTIYTLLPSVAEAINTLEGRNHQ